MKSARLSLLLAMFAWAIPGLAAAQDVHSPRIKVEVYPPKTPDLQEAYDVLQRSRRMDEAQEFFGIFLNYRKT